jgi:hypothetical protein
MEKCGETLKEIFEADIEKAFHEARDIAVYMKGKKK